MSARGFIEGEKIAKAVSAAAPPECIGTSFNYNENKHLAGTSYHNGCSEERVGIKARGSHHASTM
jgi:hypothetical protein